MTDQTTLPVFSPSCIWAQGRHHAFTDLAYFQGYFWCAFRDATDHVSGDGVIRLLYAPADQVKQASKTSAGDIWQTQQVFKAEGDLRDPSLIVTPDGRLLLLAACKGDRKIQGFSHQMMLWEAEPNGAEPELAESETTESEIAEPKNNKLSFSWKAPRFVGEKDLWLWRVAYFNSNQALGIAYKVGGDPHTRLYQLNENLEHQVLIERFRNSNNAGAAVYPEGVPGRESVLYQEGEYSNEAGLCFEKRFDTCFAKNFDKNQQAWCLLRRDPEQALLGSAKPPYTEWHWRDTGFRVGGPVLTCLPDGRLLAVVRLYGYENNELVSARTSLAWLCKETGQLTECGQLLSGGDTSYAGLVVQDETLFISYYASHEGNTNIYFAQVPIHELAEPKQ